MKRFKNEVHGGHMNRGAYAFPGSENLAHKDVITSMPLPYRHQQPILGDVKGSIDNAVDRTPNGSLAGEGTETVKGLWTPVCNYRDQSSSQTNFVSFDQRES